MTRMVAAAACGLVLCIPAAASAEPQTATAELGSVRADLEWDPAAPSDFAPSLRITRPGAAFDYAPSECGGSPDREDLYCESPVVAGERSPLTVRDIDADGEPEVLVELYSAGAHCCFISRLYRWDEQAGTYVSTRRNWADTGFELRDVEGDGKFEFVSADARFGYAFAAFAESRFPIQVFAYTGSDFEDISTRYPALIRADIRKHRRAYRKLRSEGATGTGALAAFLADKYRLGEAEQGRRQVKRALRRGGLTRSERRDLRKMRRLLRRWGYAGSAASSTG